MVNLYTSLFQFGNQPILKETNDRLNLKEEMNWGENEKKKRK